MGTPPRPGWWYERARQRRGLLDAGVERLHATLRSYPGYRNVLIFGSYARGDVGPSSDLDVLAIVDSSERQSRSEFRVREHIGAIGV
ncbi:MAG TPA: nucleotidyltransferase domain-containing protein, partial [Candidatus Tumulicola sp.]|nr:nucleotidyltransferase domain-containing protein [Candidatus Tumulicola sp.]